jgi:hypothetical protein
MDGRCIRRSRKRDSKAERHSRVVKTCIECMGSQIERGFSVRDKLYEVRCVRICKEPVCANQFCLQSKWAMQRPPLRLELIDACSSYLRSEKHPNPFVVDAFYVCVHQVYMGHYLLDDVVIDHAFKFLKIFVG